MAGVWSIFVIFLVTVVSSSSRTPLSATSTCYYQPYYKQLTCKCGPVDRVSSLSLRLEYFVQGAGAGNQVESVSISSCPDLMLGLDLVSINASSIKFDINRCGKVVMDFIMFETDFAERQTLQMSFISVESVIFNSLHVDEAADLIFENIQNIEISSSTFLHLPTRSISVKNSKNFEIKNCIFLSLSPRSLVVENTNKVTIINNRMNINIMKTLITKNVLSMFVSCNHLLSSHVTTACRSSSSTQSTRITSSLTTRSPLHLPFHLVTANTSAPPPISIPVSMVDIVSIAGAIFCLILVMLVSITLALRTQTHSAKDVDTRLREAQDYSAVGQDDSVQIQSPSKYENTECKAIIKEDETDSKGVIEKSDNMTSSDPEVTQSSHMMRFGRSISAILVLSNHLQESELKLEDIFNIESGGKGNIELLC